MISNQHKILIIDFGSQFTQLILRRIRELGIYAEIHPYNITDSFIKQFNPKAIILSGGSESVTDNKAPRVSQTIYSLNIPILGICYGHQLICENFGGKVTSSSNKNYGLVEIEIIKNCNLFCTHKKHCRVWASHGDNITTLPKEFIVLAKSDNLPYAAIKHKELDIYGVQFHPEVSHSECGPEILSAFLGQVSRCNHNWNIQSFIEQIMLELNQKIGNQKVVLALSGGVDSTVVAVLLHKYIGNSLHCVFVDNGLLRLNEAQETVNNLSELGLNIITVDASDRFLSALNGVIEPEQKRKIVGHVFIDVFKDVIATIGDVKFLAQGTIYPDVIESAATASGKKVTIKSHHNVGGLPNDLGGLEIIEPIKFCFKDEVRQIGKHIGVPEKILKRHPFPGPGLSIRILGEVTKEKCEILRKADHIFISALKEYNLYESIWQAYVALLSAKSVGVMGDSRTYQYICALRAVHSVDGMTADCAELPHDMLSYVARKIVNEVYGINRVMYDITSKPPATIEME